MGGSLEEGRAENKREDSTSTRGDVWGMEQRNLGESNLAIREEEQQMEQRNVRFIGRHLTWTDSRIYRSHRN